jgi:anti-sigma factor RsiW
MHVDEDVVAYLNGELAPAEQARVTVHLEACEACRRAVAESRAVLAALAPGRPAPPPVEWARYQAELRAKVARRPRGRWLRPWPALAAAAVAAIVLVLTLQTPDRRLTDLASLDETVLGAQLPMLQQYRMVERLDMLEDLDVIGQLDRIGTR